MLPHPRKPRFVNAHVTATNGYWTKMRPHDHQVAVAESQHHIIDPTNPRRALDDGVEDRLNIGRRMADDTEYLGRCRLVLQGLAQFRVALLDLLEQSHVLNGDNGLISEDFKKSYLLFGEGPNFRPANRNHSDRSSLPEQGCRKNSASATGLLHESRFRKLSLNLGHDVVHMNRLLINNGPARWRAPNWYWCRIIREWYRPIFRYPFICLSIPAINNCIGGVTQSCSILCNYIQNRLDVRRRTGNDAQDFTCSGLLLKRFLEFLKQPHVLDSDDRLIGEG